MSQISQITPGDAVLSFPDLLGTREMRLNPANPPRPYTVIRAVGNGVSGTAFLVSRAADEKNYIAKITDLATLSEKKKSYARSEIRCLAQCEHFAIIKHIDSAETPDHTRLLLLMELADAGDLARQVKLRNGNLFREHEVAFLFLQIVLAVDYMHRRGILHRDIKSANVFLMSCGIVKIGDLGFSQVYMDSVSGEVGRTFCGTPYYLAPELWRRHRYSKKADVWSLAVLLYEMAALKRPFVASSMLELYDRVVAGDYEPLPNQFSQDMCDVIRQILVFDPDARPATSDILNMPYMRFVASQFENTITQNSHFSPDEKSRILDALRVARDAASATEPTPIPAPGTAASQAVQKRGIVHKLGTGGWKQRYLLLAKGVLTISVIENTVGDTKNLNVTNIQGVMPCLPSDLGGRVGCFCIVLADANGSHVYFQAANEADAQLWVDAIEHALEAEAQRLATTQPSASGAVVADRTPTSPVGAAAVTMLPAPAEAVPAAAVEPANESECPTSP